MECARSLLVLAAFAALLATAPGARGQQASGIRPPTAADPVILDTDIGDDIDDAFALALALRSPELKLIGITTAYGDTDLRAKLVDRYLVEVGRSDIPVDIGVPTPHTNVFTQAAYAKPKLSPIVRCALQATSDSQIPTPQREKDRYEECKKDRYDAVGFLLRNAKEHPGEITLIAIGPLFNIQAAIERDPATFRKLKRVVMMGGSLYRGYDDMKSGAHQPPEAEWNIAAIQPGSTRCSARSSSFHDAAGLDADSPGSSGAGGHLRARLRRSPIS